MTPQRVLVCGGRDFKDEQYVFETLEKLRAWLHKDFAIVHGGARGADSAAGEWARLTGVPCFTCFAAWDHYGREAGARRNRWMLDWFCPELVVAFPGGPGTADMVKQARRRNVAIYSVNHPHA